MTFYISLNFPFAYLTFIFSFKVLGDLLYMIYYGYSISVNGIREILKALSITKGVYSANHFFIIFSSSVASPKNPKIYLTVKNDKNSAIFLYLIKIFCNGSIFLIIDKINKL